MGDTDLSPINSVHLDLTWPDLTEIGRAREFARDFLAGSPADVVETCQLLTSELVTNAMLHGSGAVRISLDCAAGILRVRVRDGSVRRPAARDAPNPDETRGNGLLLVETLALSWGFAPDLLTGGKTVWFRLRTE